jgi:hypothetical protein
MTARFEHIHSDKGRRGGNKALRTGLKGLSVWDSACQTLHLMYFDQALVLRYDPLFKPTTDLPGDAYKSCIL